MNEQQPEALILANNIHCGDDQCGCSLNLAASELRRLHVDNENLRSVMIAAAEEISAHWDAHCDDEGYGPSNLMHRLEKGLPSEYAYKAGDFERLRVANIDCVNHFNALMAERNELLAALQGVFNACLLANEDEAIPFELDGDLLDAARIAINKATGEKS